MEAALGPDQGYKNQFQITVQVFQFVAGLECKKQRLLTKRMKLTGHNLKYVSVKK